MANSDTVREAVAIFDRTEYLEEAIDELLSSGFDRSEISLLATSDAIEEKLGHIYQRSDEAEDDPSSPRVAYVSRNAIGDAEGWLIAGPLYVAAVATIGVIVASGGTALGAITAGAMAGGAGGLIGSVLARYVEHRYAHYLAEQIEKGGLVLWVRTMTPEDEKRAKEILGRHSAHDVHVHSLPAAA